MEYLKIIVNFFPCGFMNNLVPIGIYIIEAVFKFVFVVSFVFYFLSLVGLNRNKFRRFLHDIFSISSNTQDVKFLKFDIGQFYVVQYLHGRTARLNR